MLKIEKFIKNKNGMYTIVLDGNNYTIHEDLILKYGVLLKRDLSDDDLVKMEKENLKYQIYEVALKLLKTRLRSKNELKNLLIKKNFSINSIMEALDLLEKQGYLDNNIYLDSYIHDRILFSIDGPLKIKKYLLEQDIPITLIDEKLNVFSKDLECERLNKIISKKLKSNRQSLVNFKKSMKYYCSMLGYSNDTIYACLDSISSDDTENYKREYDKLYKKLSKKYTGSELENVIKQKLYLKGFYQ